ncbi:MAG: hypothetical protein BWY09_02174 [Candidatus Hydrogenedentes bacterium ADurb.Bin179]|nr:MAG: hypothetical protein BWY09_02174 [Candidatus Hydrogenedentes bacterium ADurb.Bin179]
MASITVSREWSVSRVRKGARFTAWLPRMSSIPDASASVTLLTPLLNMDSRKGSADKGVMPAVSARCQACLKELAAKPPAKRAMRSLSAVA